jgi:hypothetical protein
MSTNPHGPAASAAPWPGWDVVASGLRLVRAGCTLGVLGSVTLAVLTLAQPAPSPRETPLDPPKGAEPPSYDWVGLAGLGVGGLAYLLVVVGRVRCCRVPPGAGLAGPAGTAALATGLCTACFVLLHGVAWTVPGPAPDPQSLLVGALAALGYLVAGLVGELAFLVLLYRLGRFLQSRELRAGVSKFCLLILCALVGLGVSGVLAVEVGLDFAPGVAARNPAPAWVGWLLLGLAGGNLILALCVLFAYLKLLLLAEETIEHRFAAPAAAPTTTS